MATGGVVLHSTHPGSQYSGAPVDDQDEISEFSVDSEDFLRAFSEAMIT